jgi:uncharacterized protein (DUF1330 family)
MPAYAVGHIKISDPEKYRDYEAGFFEALAPFNGTILAVDDAPTVLEGNAPDARVVILSFPDQDALNAWYSSDAYQAIAAIRHKAADSQIITVRAFELPG